jgi:3-oxoacid CoA-transferase B subunit
MQPLNRLQIAWRAAQDIEDGMLVNLGMGMPVHVADYLRPDVDVFIQAENGVIGAGPLASPERADPDLVDASSRRITLRPGAAIVDSSWSFAMIRGGHIDMCVLGAMQVSARGDLANWMIPGKMVKGMGGAMDLVAGARKVIVMMEHVTRGSGKGERKILNDCSLPLTAVAAVHRVITDLCVLDVDRDGLVLRELAPNVSKEEVQAQTEPKLRIAPDLKTMDVS